MTELCNVVTRETKEVKNKIGDIEELNEGINAEKTVEEEDAELGVDAAREPNMVMDETAQNANEDKHALKNIQTIEVEAVNAKKPELGADVEKVYETA
jgi:fibronectin type 3 domain-containing protein